MSRRLHKAYYKQMNRLIIFLVLLFSFSIPLWILGYFFDATKVIPIKLPISALQFLCVIFSAIIVTKKSEGSAMPLLKSGFDFRRIKNKNWQGGNFYFNASDNFILLFYDKIFRSFSKQQADPDLEYSNLSFDLRIKRILRTNWLDCNCYRKTIDAL